MAPVDRIPGLPPSGAKAEPAPGAKLSVSIEGPARDGAFVAVAGGRRFPLTGAPPDPALAAAGGRFFGTVVLLPDGRLGVRLAAERPAPDVSANPASRAANPATAAARLADASRSLGLPADAVTFAALRAFMAEGLPLEPGTLGKVRRLLERRGSSARDLDDDATAAARAAAKGFSPDADGFEALVDVLGASDRHGGEGGRRDGEDRRDRDRDRRDRRDEERKVADSRRPAGNGTMEADATTGVAASTSSDIPAGRERVRALAAELKAFCTRSSATGDAALGLYNHVKSGRLSWVHVPYAFELDRLALNGALRILIDTTANRCGFLAGTARTEGGLDLGFSLESVSEGRTRLRIVDRRGSTAVAARVAETAARVAREADVELDASAEPRGIPAGDPAALPAVDAEA